VSPEFGVFLIPEAASYPGLRRQVEAAERGGLDLIGIQDHPYQPRYLDSFALIADLLARTERLRFFPDVANLPLRHPALLATTAASLDVMSGGRFELGLGAGAFWDAIVAMGGPRRGGREALEALDEAIRIIRLSWSGERTVQFEGRHYSISGVHAGPPPAHPIEIWVGGYKPRMLGLIGGVADGWIPSLPYAPPEQVPEMQRRIDAGAEATGRDPAAIRRAYNVIGEIAGDAGRWVETFTGFALELGFDTFVFWPGGDDALREADVFASDVVPAVREAVGAARSIGASGG
jgi:alkanesulfonate monooxygenase SsuD/methylene tetrahydromethanopterin reductase-like flavin-dependent oxidoreductase (luciferase family)